MLAAAITETRIETTRGHFTDFILFFLVALVGQMIDSWQAQRESPKKEKHECSNDDEDDDEGF